MQNTLLRIWIWDQHLNIFFKYPLTGIGTYEFSRIAGDHDLLKEIPTDGSESFFTGLLARVGASSIFFILFLFSAFRRGLKKIHFFSYIIPILLIYSLLFYASFFVAYNFITILWIGLFNFHHVIEIRANSRIETRGKLFLFNR
jgi:hypothetical protein